MATNQKTINVSAGNASATTVTKITDTMPGVPCPDPAGYKYVGARYVPLFADPIQWDETKQTTYEPLTIVLYQGNSYTSKQYVPTGIDITNEDYWAETGNFNAQLEQANNNYSTLIKNTIFVVNSTLDFGSEPANVSFVMTRGFRTINDGGSALYRISSSGEDNGIDVIKKGEKYYNLILEQEMNAECFGAYGDGINDDIAFINRGSELTNLVLNKTYLISEAIIPKYNLIGSGKIIKSGSFITSEQNGAIIINQPNIAIKGLTIQGLTASPSMQYPAVLTGFEYGIVVSDNALNITINGCEIINFNHSGIVIWSNNAENILIENCTTNNCGTGLVVEKWKYDETLDSGKNITVINSIFNSQGGSTLSGFENIVLISSIFTGNYSSAGTTFGISDAYAKTNIICEGCSFIHTGSQANGARALLLFGYLRTSQGGSPLYSTPGFKCTFNNCLIDSSGENYVLSITEVDFVKFNECTLTGSVQLLNNSNVTDANNEIQFENCLFNGDNLSTSTFLVNDTLGANYNKCKFESKLENIDGVFLNSNKNNAFFLNNKFEGIRYPIYTSGAIYQNVTAIGNVTDKKYITNITTQNNSKNLFLQNTSSNKLTILPLADPNNAKTLYQEAPNGSVFVGTNNKLYCVNNGNIYLYDGSAV